MEAESAGEPLGLLKVLVIQGKKLVIRDFKSSDPYVIVKLGNQVISRSFLLWAPSCSDLALLSNFIFISDSEDQSYQQLP